jgi:hypothetical protein
MIWSAETTRPTSITKRLSTARYIRLPGTTSSDPIFTLIGPKTQTSTKESSAPPLIGNVCDDTQGHGLCMSYGRFLPNDDQGFPSGQAPTSVDRAGVGVTHDAPDRPRGGGRSGRS